MACLKLETFGEPLGYFGSQAAFSLPCTCVWRGASLRCIPINMYRTYCLPSLALFFLGTPQNHSIGCHWFSMPERLPIFPTPLQHQLQTAAVSQTLKPAWGSGTSVSLCDANVGSALPTRSLLLSVSGSCDSGGTVTPLMSHFTQEATAAD